MNLITLHHLENNARFTEEEANRVTPLLISITRKTKNDVNKVKTRLVAYRHNQLKTKQCQAEIHRIIRKWGEKVCRLGATPVGVWKVLIPSSGTRPFEWEFPASKVS